ncbi:hypothetical protein M2277_005065 [Paenibacillus sp. LBL]|uniref:hypothetical protein n=1 Tax=Paenibacillus sp. LBL TaxID=2940563 RepID=UPI002472F9FC|nr:hypothetical protein [Paenibacillus sp. LBL]MDH6674373.1 hypothetical protein [Paenibacillus sp. LBL]
MDISHLEALELRLSNERVRLNNAKTENEKEIRKVWIVGIEKEIEKERQFLGIKEEQTEKAVSDEDLLNELLD